MNPSHSEYNAARYHRLKLVYFFAGLLTQAVALALLAATPLSTRLADASQAWPVAMRNIGYFFFFFLFLSLFSLPADFVSGHLLEKRFELSKQSFAGWLFDEGKKT